MEIGKMICTPKVRHFWRCISLSMMVSFMPIIASAYYDKKYGDYLHYEVIGTTVIITNCNDSAVSVNIPNRIDGLRVTSIGNGAFDYCSSLTSIEIPNSITNIGKSAFYGCLKLANIEIPNSVINIREKAFYYCTSLKDIYYTGTKAEWKKIDIGVDNEYLQRATIHCSGIQVPSTIYSADEVGTQVTDEKLIITFDVDDDTDSATVYVAFRNNGKIVDVKKATLSNLQAEVSLSNKTYTDMNIYIWNSRQQPYTYVKNIKK